MITVNGESLEFEGKTVEEYLTFANYNLKRVAVELNGDIVPKAKYNEVVLHSGDVLEVVSFVGGG